MWSHIQIETTIKIYPPTTEPDGPSSEMKDTLCSTIYNWFHKKYVDPSKYLAKYTKAIETQTAIGWHHLFMGHFFTEWADTHGPFKTPSGSQCKAYTCGGPPLWKYFLNGSWTFGKPATTTFTVTPNLNKPPD